MHQPSVAPALTTTTEPFAVRGLDDAFGDAPERQPR
jgi:hypothetical protein